MTAPEALGAQPYGTYLYSVQCCGSSWLDIRAGMPVTCPGCQSVLEAPASSMTLEQARLLSCALELDRTLKARQARAALMSETGWFTPAGHAAYLMGLAMIDQRVRQLRGLVADTLEATAGGAA